MQITRILRIILLPFLITLGLLMLVQNVYHFSTNIRQQQTVAETDKAALNRPSSTTQSSTPSAPPTTDPEIILLDTALETDFRTYLNDIIDMAESRANDITTTDTVPTVSQQLQSILKCYNRELAMEKIQYGSYWLLRNLVSGSISRSVGCAETITYTTNGDYTFFDSLAMVVSRWLAPISFAIFAPGYDFNATIESIQYVRNCLPESELIRQYVSFHVYFPAKHMPSQIPHDEVEANSWEYDCEVSPYENVDRQQMYKTANNLTYPINVGRNIARYAANTYFVFPCDIELFPSVGLVQQFLEMVVQNPGAIVGGNKSRVFVLPVFEMEKNLAIPKNKTEMLELFRQSKVIPFHAHRCKSCHLVPLQAEWMNASDSEELSIFTVGKREGNFAGWEPFYISDNREPMFDERVTWEGQSNKRIQGYAMCLLRYEYHILHPAFLMHSPGIKYPDRDYSRLKFMPPMNHLIKSTIMPEYKILYGNDNDRRCRI